MMSINELVALAATDEIPPGAELPAAVAEVEAALAAHGSLYADTHGKIAALERDRLTLLLDASDVGVKKLIACNEALGRHKLDAERLAAVEPRLLARLRALDEAGKRDALGRIIEAYRTTISAFGSAMRAALQARENMVRARELAVASGFERVLGVMDLPSLQFPIEGSAIARFVVGATAQLEAAVSRPKPPDLHVVRFVASHPPYRVGERAGFSASHAWALVDGEQAVFADPKRRPPRPATKTEI